MGTDNTSDVVDLILELQAIGQSGEFYGHDDYDRDRATRTRELAAELLARLTGSNPEQARDVLLEDYGYRTPKVDSRAVIFGDGSGRPGADGDKILLVHEGLDGRWSLPGGWIDEGLSVRENTIKEAYEESGMQVKTDRLLAVIDKRKHNPSKGIFHVYTFFVECTLLGGDFAENLETTEIGWFGLDELPEMSLGKTTPEQVAMCLKAHRNPNWQVIFD